MDVQLCISTPRASPSFARISAQAGCTKYLRNAEDVDFVTGSECSMLTTFDHFPYFNWFPKNRELRKCDIAILGAWTLTDSTRHLRPVGLLLHFTESVVRCLADTYTVVATDLVEPRGWFSREYLDGLQVVQLIGADVVEVAPA